MLVYHKRPDVSMPAAVRSRGDQSAAGGGVQSVGDSVSTRHLSIYAAYSAELLAINPSDESIVGFICKMGFRQYFEPANPRIPTD
ncbi:MAG: hypothetical protein LBU32_03015 [Clostridiales bacterium]|nr:hypothetical protein [Clostridiales bacterium]